VPDGLKTVKRTFAKGDVRLTCDVVSIIWVNVNITGSHVKMTRAYVNLTCVNVKLT